MTQMQLDQYLARIRAVMLQMSSAIDRCNETATRAEEIKTRSETIELRIVSR